jgi:hypothetical protein
MNLYIFFSTSKKYATHYAKERTGFIDGRTDKLVQEVALIKDWLIKIEEPFWEEFKIYEDLDLSFSNKDTQNKIQKQSLKIIVFIKKFLENLIAKTTKLNSIPQKIQEIIYEYIKERAFFPKEYLNSFQVNRLDFEFYGATRNITSARAGMVLAYLIISGVLVQQILIHMREVFKEYKKLPKIGTNALYIGSIIHYLTRDSFLNSPKVVTNCIGLFNYYRNYHLYNELIEKQEDSFRGMLTLEGTENDDEYAEFLVPENNISAFWKLNPAFVETFKKFIYSWAVKLGKLIKLKFSKNDRNLLPRKRIQRPFNKTFKRRESSEEEEERKKEATKLEKAKIKSIKKNNGEKRYEEEEEYEEEENEVYE